MIEFDWDSLDFDGFLEMREELARELRRRFERKIALVFTDVVGSTAYFEQHGSVAGHALLERHASVVNAMIAKHGGRLIDTAGDGSFCVFDSAQEAAAALTELQIEIAGQNAEGPAEHRLSVRCGLHFGPALVGDEKVRGDAVHLAARIASSAAGGEIRISQRAFAKLELGFRVRSRPLPPLDLKGFSEAATLLQLDWRNPATHPTVAVIVETDEELEIPALNHISFGRWHETHGRTNDVVIRLPDETRTRHISRWHFALEHEAQGYVLHSLTGASTEVDGVDVQQGESHPIRSGSVVRIANVLTLHFTDREQVLTGLSTLL